MKRHFAFLFGMVCAGALLLSPAGAQTNSYKQTNLAPERTGLAADRAVFNLNGRTVAFAIDAEAGAISASTEKGTVALGADRSASAGAIYKGIAHVHNSSGDFLLATNFRSGKVEIFDSNLARTEILGSSAFNDPDLPAVPAGVISPGFAAFGAHVVTVHSTSMVAVTYALQDAAQHDPLRFAGAGFVDLFSTNGTLLRRISDSHLNAPFGVVMPPASFGAFGVNGDLLIGNFGDGTINAFDSVSGNFVAQMKDQHGAPIANAGLRDLEFTSAGDANDPKAMFISTGSGNGSFVASILPDATPNATTPDFTISATPSTQTITVGSAATYQVTVGSLNAFNSAVSLACSGQPAHSTCSITSPVTPPSDGTIMATLTVSTTSYNPNPYMHGIVLPRLPGRSTYLKFLFVHLIVLLALIFGNWRWGDFVESRRAHFALGTLAMILAVGAALAATGCGYSSSSANNGTPPGPSTIMITGTSGQLTHSTSVMLTVQ